MSAYEDPDISMLISDIPSLAMSLDDFARRLHQQNMHIPFGLVCYVVDATSARTEYLEDETAAEVLSSELYSVWLQRRIRQRRREVSGGAAASAMFMQASMEGRGPFPVISCRIERAQDAVNYLSEFLPPEPSATKPLIDYSRPGGPRLFFDDPPVAMRMVSDGHMALVNRFKSACDQTAQLMRAGRFQEALRPAISALQQTTEIYGIEHVQLCKSLANFGWVLSELGQGQRAVASYEMALDVAREIGNTDRVEQYEADLEAEKNRWRDNLGDWSLANLSY